MMSLFSSFDFSYYGVLFLIPIFSMLLFFSSSDQILVSFNKKLLNNVMSVLQDLISVSKVKELPKFFSIFCMSIFSTLFFVNISAIFPFSFPFTTQMGFVLLFALSCWGSFLMFYMVSNYKKLISHKIPEGSPLVLSVFLFLVEVVSEVIRPLTLTLRLVGNLIVGHVLLSLLFWLIENMPLFSPFFLVLNFVEIMVCVIQSYIFFTLTVMYFSEVE